MFKDLNTFRLLKNTTFNKSLVANLCSSDGKVLKDFYA